MRGADTGRFEAAPQAAGLLAASLGLSRMFADDLAQLEAGMTLYDAFYRWCRDATDETHTWHSAKRPAVERCSARLSAPPATFHAPFASAPFADSRPDQRPDGRLRPLTPIRRSSFDAPHHVIDFPRRSRCHLDRRSRDGGTDLPATAQRFKCTPLQLRRVCDGTRTAKVDIDALRCATTRGRFEIIFQREKENGPDLEFIEQFEWQTGSLQTGHIDVSVDFWIDEAVQSYAIGATARCPCRQ